MPAINEIVIDTAERNVKQKPRKTEVTKPINKSESQDRELEYIKTTSHLLRELRYARQYTQADLAKKTGIRQQLVSRIDRNDLNPRVSTLKKYLEACGVDLDELLQDALNKIQDIE